MTVGDVFRCSVRYQQFGYDLVNVLHFRQLTEQTSGARSALASLTLQVKNAVEGELLPILNGSVSLAEIEAYSLADPSFAHQRSSIATGGRAVEAAPTQVALVVSLNTGRRGRSYRGRTFIGGWSVDNFVAGEFAGIFTGIGQFFGELIPETTPVDAGDATFGLTVYSPTLQEDNLVSSAVGKFVPATIRRRRIGTGS